jgi:Icc-related predicted phosphoesterase
MKILAFGDLHGDTSVAERLAEKAEKENVDLVVLCGDITYAEQSTDNLIGPFAKRKKKVVLIPGNHESIATADFLAEQYGATNLHGYSIKLGDIGLFGAGGANIGLLQLDEKEIYDLLKKGHEKIKDSKTKIMVTHVHPTESKMEKFTQFFPGSSGVKKAIDAFKPSILLCSHVHEAEGIEEKIGNTKVINVGKEGKIIEF